MSAVYASTTREWFETLRQFHHGERVAFWQPTPANPRRINVGEPWYFKQLGRPQIVGVGRFAGWENLSVKGLFEKYGTRSGYQTLPELIRALEALTDERVSTSDMVGNVVLDDFTPFARAVPLSEIGLDDLSVRFRYLSGGDPVAAVARLPFGNKQPPPTNSPIISGNGDIENFLGPTVGPAPTDWRGEISGSSEGEAFTYVIRFGPHDIWKIGWARDVKKRLRTINNHIPTEIIPTQWYVVFTQKWDAAAKAHRMEQLVLSLLKEKRTQGERVRCSESEVLTAWRSALA